MTLDFLRQRFALTRIQPSLPHQFLLFHPRRVSVSAPFAAWTRVRGRDRRGGRVRGSRGGVGKRLAKLYRKYLLTGEEQGGDGIFDITLERRWLSTNCYDKPGYGTIFFFFLFSIESEASSSRGTREIFLWFLESCVLEFVSFDGLISFQSNPRPLFLDKFSSDSWKIVLQFVSLDECIRGINFFFLIFNRDLFFSKKKFSSDSWKIVLEFVSFKGLIFLFFYFQSNPRPLLFEEEIFLWFLENCFGICTFKGLISFF